MAEIYIMMSVVWLKETVTFPFPPKLVPRLSKALRETTRTREELRPI